MNSVKAGKSSSIPQETHSHKNWAPPAIYPLSIEKNQSGVDNGTKKGGVPV